MYVCVHHVCVFVGGGGGGGGDGRNADGGQKLTIHTLSPSQHTPV